MKERINEIIKKICINWYKKFFIIKFNTIANKYNNTNTLQVIIIALRCSI